MAETTKYLTKFAPLLIIFVLAHFTWSKPYYYPSHEPSERKWILLENMQALVSTLILNMTEICPLNQHAFLSFAQTVIRNTISSIYENNETALESILFFETFIIPIKNSLSRCLESPNVRITVQDFFESQYPERIFHLDLMQHADDTDQWYDFRRCVRMRENSPFYPGVIPAILETFWNSFLLGYFACSDYWNTLDSWSYMDTVQTTIMVPIYKRWKAKFPSLPFRTVSNQNTDKLAKELKFNGNDLSIIEEGLEIANVSSIEYMLHSLEKCNVILFIKNPSDPIPCFADVLDAYDTENKPHF